ncbi:hypothetical protein D3C79_930160 [compost metagenome]
MDCFSALMRSSGKVRQTATVTSINRAAPALRMRIFSVASIAGKLSSNAPISSLVPAGAVSISESNERLPSFRAATTIKQATINAAIASARPNPSNTKTIPSSTTAEDSMSEKKCSASASSAALSVAFATRFSALTRK